MRKTFTYYFDNCDGFDYEVDEQDIEEFLIHIWTKESKTPITAEVKKVLRHIIRQHSLAEDEYILDDYEYDMEEYFEDYARDCWEDSKDYEEDERDWFGTKANVIGL